MLDFLQKNLKYPKSARMQNVEGKVFVQFVVNKDGSIADVEPIKGITGDCDREAAGCFNDAEVECRQNKMANRSA